MVEAYKNKTFLTALNILLVDVVAFVAKVASGEWSDALTLAIIGGALYVQLMSVVLIEKARGEADEQREESRRS